MATGRGSELQEPYLPEKVEEEVEEEDPDDEEEDASDEAEGDDEEEASDEEEEAEQPIKKVIMPGSLLIKKPNLDGYRSQFILIRKPLAKDAT